MAWYVLIVADPASEMSDTTEFNHGLLITFCRIQEPEFASAHKNPPLADAMSSAPAPVALPLMGIDLT